MTKNILCFGDSITWGCVPRWEASELPSERYDRSTRWTAILAERLGAGFSIIEEGLGGRTTIYSPPGEPWKNGLPYLLPCLLSHRPLDLVIIMLGVNDLYLPIQPPPKALGDGIRTLAEVVQSTPKAGRDNSPPQVLVIAPTPIKRAVGRTELYDGFGAEQGERLSHAFPTVYAKIAAEKGCHFLDASLYAEPSDADGVHWTPESNHNLAPAIEQKVRTIFA